MHIKNKKDFWSGFLFVAFGFFFASLGTRYIIGTATSMGPGYFPTMLGIILMGMGCFISLMSLSRGAEAQEVGRFSWRTILLVLGAVVLFGFLLNRAGLVIALAAVIIVSSYASHEFGWKATLVNAVVLIALCLAVFVYALSLQFPLWPTFFAG